MTPNTAIGGHRRPGSRCGKFLFLLPTECGTLVSLRVLSRLRLSQLELTVCLARSPYALRIANQSSFLCLNLSSAGWSASWTKSMFGTPHPAGRNCNSDSASLIRPRGWKWVHEGMIAAASHPGMRDPQAAQSDWIESGRNGLDRASEPECNLCPPESGPNLSQSASSLMPAAAQQFGPSKRSVNKNSKVHKFHFTLFRQTLVWSKSRKEKKKKKKRTIWRAGKRKKRKGTIKGARASARNKTGQNCY